MIPPLIIHANRQTLPSGGSKSGGCGVIVSSPHECRQRRDKMISVGVDTHLKTHQVEMQNNEGKVMWRGQINNDRKGFGELLEKLKTVERSNRDSVRGVYVNSTETYHLPLQG